MNKLTDLQVKRAKAVEKDSKLSGGGGTPRQNSSC